MGSGEDENIKEFVKNVDAASEDIKPFSNATEDPPMFLRLSAVFLSFITYIIAR